MYKPWPDRGLGHPYKRWHWNSHTVVEQVYLAKPKEERIYEDHWKEVVEMNREEALAWTKTNYPI